MIKGLGFRVQGLGLGCGVWGLRFKVLGVGFGSYGLGLRVILWDLE
jgi:hypothetical protein